jgi:competence protein ComEC
MAPRLFLSAILGFIFGVAGASFWPASAVAYLWLLSPLGWFWPWRRRWVIIIFMIVFSSGFYYYQICSQRQLALAKPLAEHYNDTVAIAGTVIQEPEPGISSQPLTIKVITLTASSSHLTFNEAAAPLVLVTAPLYPQYQVGDYLSVSGRLTAPLNWSAFRYDRYLARYNIYGLFYYPKIETLSPHFDAATSFYRHLLMIKKQANQLIDRNLPEPLSGLANALLLGYKKTLFKEEQAAFSCCGLSHIIAISGSHLTLLAALAFNFLLALGWSRRQSFRPVVIFIWFYTLLTGWQTSAVRAAIMSSLTLWGQQHGRGQAGGRLLIVAAAAMLFNNPFLLRDDLGFQLSFAAMAALLWLYPALKQVGENLTAVVFKQRYTKTGWHRFRLALIDTLALTMASQLTTWPLSVFNFGKFSLIAPVANAAIIWSFAWLLPGLLLATTASLIFPAAAAVWFFPLRFLLYYVWKLAAYLASWPAACFNWTISPAALIIYYMSLITVMIIINRRAKPEAFNSIPKNRSEKRFGVKK